MASEPVTGNPTINNLRDKRLNCWNQATAISDRAYNEDRDLTAEENRQFDEWDAEMMRLDTRIQALCAGEKRAKETEDAVSQITRRPVAQEVAVRSAAEMYQLPQVVSFEEETAELRKFVLGETRTYQVGWPTAIERRTLYASGTNPPMPTSFIHQLYVFLMDTSSIRQAGATVISTTTGESVLVPRATAEGTVTWLTEASAMGGTDAAFSSVSLGAHKLGKLIQVSKELATDVGFDLVGYLAQSAGRNIGIATNYAYCSGAAASQPSGFLGQATGSGGNITGAAGAGGLVGLPTATAGEYGTDYLFDLYHGIIPQYRPRASWMAADGTIKVIRRMKDTLGRPIWEPSLQAGVPDTLLGKPVYANPGMPAFGASATPIAFGDFSAYYVRDVTPLRFERSDEYAFNTDLISFRALMRTDGILVDPKAIVLYTCPAT